jgi:hypothetical protein
MALTIKVTAAGRAALRNAAGDGTNAVRIATVGVTATAFAPGQPAPNEIKRIATIKGGATAPDTIHVTISDTGADVYSVRGFAFYLADGTLFASYGQANVIVEKSAQATMMLAVDVKFADIDAAQITFGDTNFNNPAATNVTLGVVRLALEAEAIDGTDDQTAVTPKGLMSALNARLGKGAPSDFIKTLLTKLNVVAFCTALGIRGAAQYDTGSGNNLDADLLDGKHGDFYLDYGNMKNVPDTSAPAAHKHSADDITSGTLAVARGGTGAGTFTKGGYLVGNDAGALQTKAAAEVLTDIGAAPKSHSHAISNVNGLQDALDAKATQQQITTAVNAVVGNAPSQLDTLKKLADAIGNDPGFAAAVANALGGKVSKAGDTMLGTLTLNDAQLFINSSKVGERYTYSMTNGIARWRSGATGENESSGNAGSNWALTAFSDSGAYLHDPISVNRSTGNVTFQKQIIAKGFISIGTGYGLIYETQGGNGAIGFRTGTPGQGRYFTLEASGDFTIPNGGMNAAGAITAAGGFQSSDRRLKANIKARQVERGLALKIARMFCEWDRIADGVHDVGLIAQRVKAIASRYVIRGKRNGRKAGMLAIDKAGIALECAMDNAIHLSEHDKHIAALMKRINTLEKSA